MSLDLRLALPDDHLAVGDKPIKITCPDSIHKERSGRVDKERSLAVYPDSIRCYGCGFALGCDGTCATRGCPEHTLRCREWQIGALAALLKTDVESARKVATQYTNEALDAYRERAATEARRDPLPAGLAAAYHHLLVAGPRAHRREWLYARGLSDETIAAFQLGHDGFRFVIPVFDREGNLLTLRYRRDDAYQTEQRPKYSGLPGRNGFYLFPEDKLVAKSWVVVCEGELDAVRCWQEGWPAVSATNGAGQVPKVIAALQALVPQLTTVFLATDQDEPGKEAAYVAGRIAEDAGLRAIRLGWDGAKDITEALQLGVTLRREDYRAGHSDGAISDNLPARHAA